LPIERRSITAETALLTGVSSGIGLHLAHESAQNGHSLVIRAPVRLSSNALAKSSPLNVIIRVIAGDFEQPGATQAIFDELQSSGVEEDILV
jgi:short-subunit dehydrogenase